MNGKVHIPDPTNAHMRPYISDDILGRLKEYVASKEYDNGWHIGKYTLIARGSKYREGMTVNDALDELLAEVGF